jgi:Ca-activated chloride channel family protein
MMPKCAVREEETMNRRLILKCAALIAALTVAIFALPDLIHENGAAAATNKKDSQTSGSLRALDEAGKPAGECPLKRTGVKAEVSGFISRVTVTQDFDNPFADKIEAVYTFPLPPSAAVDDLTMLIGDRTIRGTIMRREEARAAYDNAKQIGKVASLLDQERPNIFTQRVANILPGQQIRVTISYVETLKYEDGSYEWSFPMVVAPRYDPARSGFSQDDSSPSPPRAPDGMRAGHDVSLEINLDAGVPIVGVNSSSHEIEVQRIDEKRVVVRLKDRVAIPNKDFLLTYAVAGDTIKDAVLAHRNDGDGFFTLILQPPQRVQAEDVMPKEMVFVLDTSGSMEGFPLETAKKTMELALETLYPHDTFNLITFSGDTEILFPEPVLATPENLRKAKKFLSSRKGEGGTEMMKAIKAALDPSDSQYHVRLACFMTDGQVGNDAEILAEVQKHRNARVFAMGFGDAPNRSLLDKMAQYGRGDVDYVSQTSGKTEIARRFNERIRNPLMTDVSIEWSNLSITDVYPKRIPDLFSVKPVTLSGRYSSGGKGTIRLKGKMAGQDFVREIPVELPDLEKDNDALATLWARYRIEELMAEELANTGDQAAQDQTREEITQLGLTFKLMTNYTSFVAIDDMIFTGPDEPRRVDVPVEPLPGSIASGVGAYVLVTSGSSSMIQATDVSSTITVRALQDLPLQGRSVQGLLTLAPGTVGQDTQPKASSTNFIIDGVNANFGITPGGESPGTSAAGNAPALTASGGTNGMVSLAATNEVLIQTSATQAEDSRGGDTQIRLTTQAGTNNFHGSIFYFFGNDSLDANDWFANARGQKKPPKRLNLFGASLGGPIARDKTFFFASYEGLRLRQPLTGITDVPSIGARQAAPEALRPFLEAFPVPNGASKPDGFAEFTATFANPAQHDAGSIRFDHVFRTASLRGSYSVADSAATQRGGYGFSLNTTQRIHGLAQTITGSISYTISPSSIFQLQANYSRFRVDGSYLPDEFGGATLPASLVRPAGSFAFDLNSRNAGFMIGDEASSIQRQFNLAGSINVISGNHNFKFGGDYRRLSPIIGVRVVEENVFFHSVAQAITGIAARVNNLEHIGPQTPLYKNLSLYGQDEWRKSSNLTLTYGLRWELAPAPSNHQALAVDQVNDPTTLQPAAGEPLWKTTFGNFAPSAAFAYEPKDDFVIRGGVGLFYDLGKDRSGDVFASSVPFISGFAVFNSPYPIDSPSGTASAAFPLAVFDPQLKSPYTINWHAMVQRGFGRSQVLSVAYVGSSGQRLLHTQTLFEQNPAFNFLRVITNGASSHYRALQFTLARKLSNGFQGNVSYTWSNSKDNVIGDSERNIVMASLNPELDRGPSDFDRRHQLAGFISYSPPPLFSTGLGNTVFRKWSIDSVFNARSAKPLNVLYVFPTSIGLGYFRPDIVNGAPLYISDPLVAGGRRINGDAFRVPANLQQGTLGRNSLRGFPLYQIDLALRRKFNFTDSFGVQIQADAFNVFNHANFEDPLGNDLVVGSPVRSNFAFGESMSLRGRSLASGGFASFYGSGGARALRFSVKMFF